MPTKIIKEIAEFFGKKLDRVGVELKGVSVVTIKGDKGDSPTDEELLSLIKPLVPKPIKGDQGDVPSKELLEKVIRPLIPEPIKGDTPTRIELEKIIKPLIPEPIKGDKGDSVVGKPGLRGKPGKDGSPDTGEEIIQKINKDKSDAIIKKEKVEGLDVIEQMARTAQANTNVFHNSGSFVYDYELNSLLDGVTKTFTLPSNAKIIMVFGTSAPVIFSKNTDYTYTASEITFTSQIDAATVLAFGQGITILYKIL